jgi:tetratricopeptide (TPR) repeat protein
VALNSAGNPEKAVEKFKNALRWIPELTGAKLALADAYLNAGDIETAERTLLRLTAENEFVAEAWDMLGLIAGRQGDWDRARDYHVRALSLEPYRASFHYNLGIALAASGRIKEAAAAYKAAIRIDPKDAEAHNNLALVYARAGLMDLAAASHLKALDAVPHYPEAAYNLGLAYQALGKNLQAAEAFGLALALNPNLEPAKLALDALNLRVEIAVDRDGGVAEDPTDGGTE